LPVWTKYLVDQVLVGIVPEFEARGFVWYDDFAGGSSEETASNEIPLQRRTGDLWPTVQIRFGDRARPFFKIAFAVLPPVCRKAFATEDVPRAKATVMYAPVHFRLCKGKSGRDDDLFGYAWFSLTPRRKIDSEVREAVALLPRLFEVLDTGVPQSWLSQEMGYVEEHIMLAGSWSIDQRRRDRMGHEEVG